MKTFSKKHILSRCYNASFEREFPMSSVYFLINNGEIIYIGRSTHTLERIRMHKNNRVEFDSVFFIEIDWREERLLSETEKVYIKKFTPELNIMNTGKPRKYASRSVHGFWRSFVRDLAMSVKDYE